MSFKKGLFCFLLLLGVLDIMPGNLFSQTPPQPAKADSNAVKPKARNGREFLQFLREKRALRAKKQAEMPKK